MSDPASAVRSRAACSAVEPFQVVEVRGPDALAFLQTQLPVDVTALAPGEGAFTARLDARGRVRFLLTVLRGVEGALLLTESGQSRYLAEDLERFHVREDLQVAERSRDLAVLEVHGPGTPELLAGLGVRAGFTPYRHSEAELAGVTVTVASHPWTGDPGVHIVVPRGHRDAVLDVLLQTGIPTLAAGDLETLRVEGGLPASRDLAASTLLAELDRPDMVSHTKGCYLGQETVARVHNRGAVQYLMRALLVEGDRLPPPGTAVVAEGKEVGRTASAVHSPSLHCPVALARVRRRWAVEDTTVHVRLGNDLVAARVRSLPPYRTPGPAEAAEQQYRAGLEAFREDRFAAARDAFEKAVLLRPDHAAALEALGVAHERLGDLDRAAEIMQELALVDPENPMPWTNLSRYHALRGRIEEAEEARARALHLDWKRREGEEQARRRQEEEAAADRARREERETLFRRVLELDPDDVVANFGLGKLLLDQDRHEEAAACFAAAVEGKPDYSMAYRHLGVCLAATGRIAEAAEVFQAGIRTAREQGDLMPLQDMERRLRELPG